MTPDEMADIHARAMTIPPAWTVPTMKGFLSAPGAIFVHHRQGFALGRIIADEAELLTIAVAPKAQGRGSGRSCLERFVEACRDRGATRIFLEVAAGNGPALALYATAGFLETGRRRAYYRHPSGETEDALLMTLDLSPAQAD